MSENPGKLGRCDSQKKLEVYHMIMRTEYTRLIFNTEISICIKFNFILNALIFIEKYIHLCIVINYY